VSAPAGDSDSVETAIRAIANAHTGRAEGRRRPRRRLETRSVAREILRIVNLPY
jgi:hypothetical protein